MHLITSQGLPKLGARSAVSTAAIFSLFGASFAQTIASCNGNQAPNWDDCAAIESLFDAQIGYFPNFYPGCTIAAAPDGVDPNSLNCRISICSHSADYQVSKSEATGGWAVLDTDCRPANAGGVYPSRNGKWLMQISNNPNYPATRRREESIAKERGHAREFVTKRQQDSDTGYTLAIKSVHVERPGAEIAVTGNLPAGSVYTTTQSDSKTSGVQSSVNAGFNFFEIFSASVDTTGSYETTSSSSVGLDIKIDCPSGTRGMLYWYPLFTEYRGYYTPSGDNVNWYIPEDTSESGSNYRVRCLS